MSADLFLIFGVFVALFCDLRRLLLECGACEKIGREIGIEFTTREIRLGYPAVILRASDAERR